MAHLKNLGKRAKHSRVSFILTIQLLPLLASSNGLAQDAESVLKKALLDQGPPSAEMKSIQQSWNSIKAGKYLLALQGSKKISDSSLYADYKLYLNAQAELELGRKGGTHLEQARQSAFRLLNQFPSSPLERKAKEIIAQTEWIQARALAQKGLYDSAVTSFLNAMARVEAKRKLLWITQEDLTYFSRSCVKSKKPLCVPYLQELAMAYPDVSKEKKAIQAEAKKFIENLPSKTTYDRKFSPYPSDERDVKALSDLTPTVISKDSEDAIDGLKKFVVDFPKSGQLPRALYWLQNLLQKDDEEDAPPVRDRLVNENPMTFYGLKAALESNIDITTKIIAEMPNASSTDPLLWGNQSQWLKRALSFTARGLPEFAKIELDAISIITNYQSSFLVFLAALADKVGNHLFAFRALGELFARSEASIISSYGLKLIFPQKFLETIQVQATKFNVDPILVLSLIKQESAFNEEAISGSGALGLMQILVGTGIDLKQDAPVRDLNKNPLNVELGTKYLAQVIKQFNGNWAMAIAAYNAGPTRVKRWLTDIPDARSSLMNFAEAIPYMETKNYVTGIMRNYFWYSYLINSERLKNFDRFWVMPTN